MAGAGGGGRAGAPGPARPLRRRPLASDRRPVPRRGGVPGDRPAGV